MSDWYERTALARARKRAKSSGAVLVTIVILNNGDIRVRPEL